ncbi:hypothetical protein BD626DRAFT_406176 [Schizophyllum amplum]|uniref:Uncharacterized protein n=1 Tax=Schizophyllum amplum TaxID=97359 RepID=A0A550C917_9AGAR|nr:hypothetical protein BD626DRAFT_406176 [Auriculariopsis ampla]
MESKPWMKCPISGATDNMFKVKLIPDSADEGDEYEVACMEWFWGLQRGGLLYYLATMHNILLFREDIARLYADWQFILVPTFKVYVDMMDFAKRAGVLRRRESDTSPRRPLTALSPPNGLFRYVFIPFTDAARKLQTEFNMQPQTDEDLNGGLNPVSKEPWLPGTESYPVVECYANPYSVCTLADRAFQYHSHGDFVTSQWSICLLHVTRQWMGPDAYAPKWFVNARGVDLDDETLASSEAAGYDDSDALPDKCSACDESCLLSRADCPRATGVAAVGDDIDSQTKVSIWLNKVDPDCDDPNSDPVQAKTPRSSLKLRRSIRIAARACPYAPPPPRPSPTRRGPWPSARACDPIRHPPSWVKRNGQFPTVHFTSNDWAYFKRGAALAAHRNDR